MSNSQPEDQFYSQFNADEASQWNEYEEEMFPALRLARVARLVRGLGRWLLVLLVILTFAMLFAPWQQSIRGEGAVVALDPYERPQAVRAPIKGLIAERGEGVAENAYVTEGQLLFVIKDQDPQYLSVLTQQVANSRTELDVARKRLQLAEYVRDNNLASVEFADEQLDAMQSARDELVAAYDRFVDQAENKLAGEISKLDAAKYTQWQLELDYKRKQELAKEGIESQLKAQESEQKFRKAEADVSIAQQNVESARHGVEGKRRERESKRQEWEAKVKKERSLLEKAQAEVEKANVEIQKTKEEITQKKSKLLESERKFRAQQTQEVRAPRDGYVMNLTVFEDWPVKPGDELCRIVPITENPAVQVWVAGNDAPLIAPGRHVRLQFEGWPAVQFSGWPSVAVGTFGGEVVLVDPTDDNGSGKFRVVVVPDPQDAPWPKHPYLRQGVRANAWILLDQVPLGYEVWRRMNGFPPALDSQQDAKTAKPPKVKI